MRCEPRDHDGATKHLSWKSARRSLRAGMHDGREQRELRQEPGSGGNPLTRSTQHTNIMPRKAIAAGSQHRHPRCSHAPRAL